MELRHSATKRIGAIDGFRGWAMLLVLAAHSCGLAGLPELPVRLSGFEINLLALVGLTTRVDLFIVLSGFCLFLPLAKSPDSFRSWSLVTYAKRRARRILPAYYAALCFPFLLWNWSYPIKLLLGRPHDWKEIPEFGSVLSHVFLVHTFFPQYAHSINFPLWTMGLEAQFYVTFPILVWAIYRYGIKILAVAIALSLFYRFLIHHFWYQDEYLQWLASITFLGKWIQFCFGMLCVWVVMRRLQTGRFLPPAAGIALVFGAIALHWLTLQGATSSVAAGRDIGLGIAFAVAIGAICLSKTPFTALVNNRVMRKLGYYSYSLYLLHLPIASWLFIKLHYVLDIPKGLWLSFVLTSAALAMTVAIGLPFFRLFEQPYLQQKMRVPATGDENSLPTEQSQKIKSESV